MNTTKREIPVLDLKPQYESLKGQILPAVQKVMETGAFIMGPDVKSFEQEAAKYLGAKHAIGVNSGTDALVIGLKAMGIGPGDEVITTPFSFFATAESISNVDAVPVFADIDPATFNIDPKEIAKKITSKTKAIMPVHIYGNPAPMKAIMEIAQKHKLQVIEDCAQSFGARDSSSGGKQTGTIGSVGAYSFFPSKNLGAYGDGGLITTNDDRIADLASMLRVHGGKKKYHNEIIGYNSRLDTVQAAILRVKLPHIDQWNESRRRVAKTYNEFLTGTSGIVPPTVYDGHVFHQYTVRIQGGKRDAVHKWLTDRGVSTMIYYPIPQEQLPVYKGKYEICPISNQAAGEVLSLPIWPELDIETIRYVSGLLKEAVRSI